MFQNSLTSKRDTYIDPIFTKQVNTGLKGIMKVTIKHSHEKSVHRQLNEGVYVDRSLVDFDKVLRNIGSEEIEPASFA